MAFIRRFVTVGLLLSAPLCFAQTLSADLPSSQPGSTETTTSLNNVVGQPNSLPAITGSADRTGISETTERTDSTETSSLENTQNQPEIATHSRSSFATFVANSLGRPLTPYGRSLFNHVPTTFSPIESANITPDYVVGPGDQIIIRVWGQTEFELAPSVQRDGTIAIPKVGEISVAGVQYRDLNTHLKNALGRIFRNFDLTVTMGRLLPITVYVVGEANRPGRFNLSPQSTLFNAIFAVGGPSAQGSLRSIKVRRGDAIVADIDVYRFITNGDRSGDIRLRSDDMIVFEKIGPQIAIAGHVNRPAIYELDAATLSVDQAIHLAGGLTNTATDALASLERIESRKTRSVAQLTLKGDNLQLPLRDGDLLQVFSIGSKFENAITIRGNVAMPMRHPWRNGVRISDLIPDKNALISASYWQAQNQLLFVDPKSDEQIKNEIKRHLPEINWSYAVIERIGEGLRPKLIPFNLGKAILEKDPAHNLELAAGDVVTVFSKNDIAVPLEEKTVYVTLSGEVKVPGVYQLRPGETLKEAIKRAGGITERAFLLGTALQREAIRREQQRRIDEIIAKIEQDLRASSAEMAASVIGPESQAFFASQIGFQQRALRAFRGAAVNGRLYLNLPRRTDLTLNELPDIALEDGDRIHFPVRQDVVNVFGAVGFQNSQIFTEGRAVNDYVDTAGGPTPRSEPDDLLVFSIDGAAHKRERHWYAPWTWGNDIALMPGDSIFVPEKIDSVPLVAQLKDWTQVLYQFGLGAAAYKTLRD